MESKVGTPLASWRKNFDNYTRKFTNVLFTNFFDCLKIILHEVQRQRQVLDIYPVTSLCFAKIIVDLVTLKSFIMVMKFFFFIYKQHKIYSSFDHKNIFIYSYHGHSDLAFFYLISFFIENISFASFSVNYQSYNFLFYFLFAFSRFVSISTELHRLWNRNHM